MKKFFLLLVLLTGLHTLSHAQAGLTADEKALRAGKNLQKQLNLTPAQLTKVTVIYARRTTQLDSLKQSPGRKGNGQRLKAIADATQAELNAVLTSAQQQQFAAWKDMKKQKMQAHRNAAADSTVK